MHSADSGQPDEDFGSSAQPEHSQSEEPAREKPAPDSRARDQAKDHSDEQAKARSDSPSNPPQAQYPGAELLHGKNADEILTRIYNGDPLGIRQRCQLRVTRLCFLVALDRLFHRAIARVAYEAPRYRGIPTLNQWIDAQIDKATHELIIEEREQEALGLPQSEPWDAHHRYVSELLGVKLDHARKGCICFNDQSENVRFAFFAVCIDGKTIGRYAAEMDNTPEQVNRRIREAFLAISMPDQAGWNFGEGGTT